jgi:GTP-binding protein
MRREAHVPRGGADGGDGGDGGNVILRVDAARRDLAHLRRKLTYAAESGGPGGRKRSHGKRGDDEVVIVPAGTQAFTMDGRKLADLTTAGEEMVIAEGGAGGWGNTHFVNPVRRAPQFAEIGLPGDELELELRLKLMADAALAGVPNAGKSSLLRRISNARPKVGDYPFTTLAPVLGTIERPDGSQLVVVDVPGLLEGASEGYGLGHQFLSHFERARMLLHTVSLEDAEAAGDAFRLIQNELWAYDPRIAQLPQIVVLTKRDLVDDDAVERANELVGQAAAELREKRGDVKAVVAVSSATGAGLTQLMQALFRAVADLDREAEEGTPMRPAVPGRTPSMPLEEYRVYRPRPKRRRWRIFKDKEGFRIAGDPGMKALAERAEFDEDAAIELNEVLEHTGAIRALKAAGVRDGASVNVCGTPLELWWAAPSDV